MRASVSPASFLSGIMPVVTVYLRTRSPSRSSWRVTTGSSSFSFSAGLSGAFPAPRPDASGLGLADGSAAGDGRGVGSCTGASRASGSRSSIMGPDCSTIRFPIDIR